MKKKKIPGVLLAIVCVLSLVSGRGGKASPGAAGDFDSGVHEPLSICSPFSDVNAFIEVVHKYYPEINFDFMSFPCFGICSICTMHRLTALCRRCGKPEWLIPMSF